jgi:hypothetical protein
MLLSLVTQRLLWEKLCPQVGASQILGEPTLIEPLSVIYALPSSGKNGWYPFAPGEDAIP